MRIGATTIHIWIARDNNNCKGDKLRVIAFSMLIGIKGIGFRLCMRTDVFRDCFGIRNADTVEEDGDVEILRARNRLGSHDDALAGQLFGDRLVAFLERQ